MWNRQKYPYSLFPKPVLFQREHPYFHITSSDFHPVPCLALHEHCLVRCCAVLILLVSRQNSKSCSNFQMQCLKKITVLNCSSDYGVHMFLFRKLVASKVSIHPARVTPQLSAAHALQPPSPRDLKQAVSSEQHLLPPVKSCQTLETPLCKLLPFKRFSWLAVFTHVSMSACKTFVPNSCGCIYYFAAEHTKNCNSIGQVNNLKWVLLHSTNTFKVFQK